MSNPGIPAGTGAQGLLTEAQNRTRLLAQISDSLRTMALADGGVFNLSWRLVSTADSAALRTAQATDCVILFNSTSGAGTFTVPKALGSSSGRLIIILKVSSDSNPIAVKDDAATPATIITLTTASRAIGFILSVGNACYGGGVA